MGKLSKITWTHHTFNPWWGCQRVSPGCQNCYAEAFAKRTGNKVWGPNTPRRLLSDSHWNEPRKWNREAEAAGERHRVFCASMADVFEDRRDLDGLRQRLWVLIAETPWVDWLLLTKRPENFQKLGDPVMTRCWIGTTTEDQTRLNARVEHLLGADAAVHFLSCEPLLGALDLRNVEVSDGSLVDVLDGDGVDWVIGGSESGPKARIMETQWLESLRDQCAQAGVPFFTKQIANKRDRKGEKHPDFWPGGADAWPRQFPKVSQ